MVIDFDGPDTTLNGQRKVFSLATATTRYLSELGLNPLLFDSGGKGYHIWLCFNNALEIQKIRGLLQNWFDTKRPFPNGVLVEIFPNHDNLPANGLGNMMRLPLGKHPHSGRYSYLLNKNGNIEINPMEVLQKYRLINSEILEETKFIVPVIKRTFTPPDKLEPLFSKCCLIATILDKAMATKKLRHVERLALLYILGALAETGKVCVHQIMEYCSNYSPAITRKWLQRYDATRKPIACYTLKNMLKDCIPEVKCQCSLKGYRCSPLNLVKIKNVLSDNYAAKDMDTVAQVAECCGIPALNDSNYTDNNIDEKKPANFHPTRLSEDLWEEILEEVTGEIIDVSKNIVE